MTTWNLYTFPLFSKIQLYFLLLFSFLHLNPIFLFFSFQCYQNNHFIISYIGISLFFLLAIKLTFSLSLLQFSFWILFERVEVKMLLGQCSMVFLLCYCFPWCDDDYAGNKDDFSSSFLTFMYNTHCEINWTGFFELFKLLIYWNWKVKIVFLKFTLYFL